MKHWCMKIKNLFHTIFKASFELHSTGVKLSFSSDGKFIPHGWCQWMYKKASIRWQDNAPPISGYWPTSEPNTG